MTNKNEIKKVLYKEKPLATLVGVENGVYRYEATASIGDIVFFVPSNECLTDDGKFIFAKIMEAQLLIRWLA